MIEQLETTDHIETLLKRHDEKSAVGKIISVAKTDAVPPGENCLSQMSRIAIETESPVGKRGRRCLIWKELPLSPMTRAYVIRTGHFVRELTFYRDILTVYEELIEEVGYPYEIPWPRCIYMEPYSKIVIDDLKPSGYKMCDKFEGLNLEHCVLVFQSLGFFHALSLLAKEKRVLPSEVFSGAHIFDSDKSGDEFQASLRKFVPVLKSWGTEWDLAASKIHALIPEVKEKLKEILTPRENQLNVFIHGDCRTNNFLFKYDQHSGKPSGVKFFDFQMTFYRTLGFDLVYFLALAPNLNVRRYHVDHLINVYHESLTLNMDILRVESSRPSLSTICDDIHRLGLFKLLLVLMVAPKAIGRDRKSEPFDSEKFFKKRLEASGIEIPVEVPQLDFETDRFKAVFEASMKNYSWE